MTDFSIRSPLVGTVVAINVAPGDVVSKGTDLLVLESMKMEFEVKAPRVGTIGEVHVAVGDQVDADHCLMSLQASQDE